MTVPVKALARGRKFDTSDYAKFLRERRKHFAECSRASPPAEWATIIESLCRDGVVAVPNFLSRGSAARMLAAFPAREEFIRSTEGDGSESVSDAHLLPAFSEFFNHPALQIIAQSYIGADAIPLRQKLEIRAVQGTLLAFDRLFHMDTWKHRLKAFLYLHDVGIEDAPMVFLRGSHRGAWRWPEEYRIRSAYNVDLGGYAATEDLAYMGCHLPHEVEDLKRRYGFHEQVCVGPAGTLILFDARGLHRASELRSSYRKILISYWIRAGHHV